MYYRSTGRAANTQAVQDTISNLSSLALTSNKREEVYIRHACHNENLYLDLGDKTWRVVEISDKGWQILDNSPVAFRRPKGLQGLPEPIRGGTIDELRSFVNVSNTQDWTLLLSWLVGSIHPAGPYPILIISGPAGSAKSTTAKVLRSLIDPNTSPLRDTPKDRGNLAIRANNNWVLIFDNLSYMQTWFSDALCVLATGGGFSTRKLYSDDDESIFDTKRPSIITGIDDLATRGDLLDRSIILNSQRVPQYRSEGEFWNKFEAARPRIIGALYDTIASALARKKDMKLTKSYRMADFAIWAMAAEEKLGLPEGAFSNAYEQNRAGTNEIVVESSPVARAIVDFMTTRRQWEGTMRDLLEEVNHHKDVLDNSRQWPQNANQLGNKIKQIETNLKEQGIEIQKNRTGSSRKVKITNTKYETPTWDDNLKVRHDRPVTTSAQSLETPVSAWDEDAYVLNDDNDDSDNMHPW